MSVSIDYQLPRHPKMMTIPAAKRTFAIGALVSLLCYCDEFQTKGHIHALTAEELAGGAEIVSLLVEAKVKAEGEGFLEATETGYLIHDFADYQTLREKQSKAGKQRAATAERDNGRFTSSRQVSPSYLDSGPQPSSTTTTTRDHHDAREAPTDLTEACEVVERLIARPLSSEESATVSGWARMFPLAAIREAVSRSAGAGKPRVEYVGGVLNGLAAEGWKPPKATTARVYGFPE